MLVFMYPACFSFCVAYAGLAEAQGVNMMNKALSTMYRSGIWLRSGKARWVGHHIYGFLGLYSRCASICLNARRPRFALTPKHHMLAHDAYDLVYMSSRATWVQNPLSRTNQVQEDFIGRPSRISRRVATRSLHCSLMLRSLIIYKESILGSDLDDRGLDAYGGL